MKKIALIVVLLALLTTCCKDDKCLDPTNPKCENYDPCYAKEMPSAKFNIEEQTIDSISTKVVWYVDSGNFAGGFLRFSSDYTGGEYKHTWYVGSETFTGAITPKRDFSDQPRPQYITISHVLQYPPDLQCFPNDDGKDSVAQTFKLIAAWTDLDTYGTFRCLLDGTTDSFDIEVAMLDFYNQPANYNSIPLKVRVVNWHNWGDTLYSDATTGSEYIGWYAGTDHYAYISRGENGYMRIDEHNRFKMMYKELEDGFYKTYRATGRKIK